MVRKMSFDDEDLYFLRIKSNTNKPSERIIKEKVISEKDYDYLHDSFDGNEITKIRYCFSYHDIDFRLDIFEDIALLEVEGEYDNIIFPDFFRVLEDVTEDEKYRNYNLLHMVFHIVLENIDIQSYLIQLQHPYQSYP